MRSIPITQAREQLASLPDRLTKDSQAISITRRGTPVLAVLPWELYMSLVETLEIMADEDLMTDLQVGIAQADRGETVPWETVKANPTSQGPAERKSHFVIAQMA